MLDVIIHFQIYFIGTILLPRVRKPCPFLVPVVWSSKSLRTVAFRGTGVVLSYWWWCICHDRLILLALVPRVLRHLYLQRDSVHGITIESSWMITICLQANCCFWQIFAKVFCKQSCLWLFVIFLSNTLNAWAPYLLDCNQNIMYRMLY